MNDNLCTHAEKLIVSQVPSKGFLGGPYERAIALPNGMRGIIKQCGARRIEIISNTPMLCDELFSAFATLEKVLMLFDGSFYPITSLQFEGENQAAAQLSAYADGLLSKRLDCFRSKDFCQCGFLKLISFQEILTSEILLRWEKLSEQLDIAYQVFLYAQADNRNPVDMNFAFLVELAEPFVELIRENTFLCRTIDPKERNTTLKMCVDAIITHFGTTIFATELRDNYSCFLSCTVGSRVRIMHIKKEQQPYFEGKACVRYSMKFVLLYRRILLELLGIPYDTYSKQLENAINMIDNW